MDCTLRPVRPDDEKLLFGWANDAAARTMARNPSQIAWEDHRVWFARKLADGQCRIWIAEVDGEAAGQVRLDRRDDDAEIDISVAPAWRGRNIGASMLTKPELTEWTGLMRLHASVRHENAPSLQIFRSAGFDIRGSDDDYTHFEKVIADAPTG